jgi:hypothetical protein
MWLNNQRLLNIHGFWYIALFRGACILGIKQSGTATPRHGVTSQET